MYNKRNHKLSNSTAGNLQKIRSILLKHNIGRLNCKKNSFIAV